MIHDEPMLAGRTRTPGLAGPLQGLAAGVFFFATVGAIPACELCAIYSASNNRGGGSSGFQFTIAEQYVSAHTLFFQGRSASQYTFYTPAFLDSSYIHLVPTYNFSSRFGLSLNQPVIHREFRRVEQQPTQDLDESGTITGLGDLALIGRLGLLQINKMKYSLNINLLAGVKFPTGDPARLDNEVNAAKADLAEFGPGHPHGTVDGVHEHDLSLGSGSYDGVFGLTTNLRWKQWFINNQTQYYLRTEARGYQFGDLFIVSGGPGAYVPLGEQSTLSLQANGFYERNARDKVLGQVSDQTGMTAWYLGPLINVTWGEHFSANAGFDWRLRVFNQYGLQTVPDYRVHGGITWRF